MKIEEAKESIEVMIAYTNGKPIQFRRKDRSDTWHDTNEPIFDWDSCDYRVKPEPKYRPFKNADEAFVESKKHDFYIKCIGMLGNGEPLHKHSTYFKIGTINDEAVHIGWFETYGFLMRNYVWADDKTPCGIKED